MKEKITGYGLNLGHFIALFALLALPSIVGPRILVQFDYFEVKRNIEFFYSCAGILSIYFLAMMIFSEKLIGRFHDLVTLKYLVVILVIFWIFYDLYMAYIYHQVYLQYQDPITRRDIVWRDVEELPDYVIYHDLLPALKSALSALRASTVIVFCYKLMAGKNDAPANNPYQRRKLRRKSISDIKTPLHPSIMKGYKKNDQSD